MMIFKKAIPRRAFLRGLGVTIALPLLDGMIPAFAAAADAKSPLRLGIVYLPNGIMMENWTPAAEGADFEFTPILQPLSAFRKQMLIVSGLSQAGPTSGGDDGDNPGDHPMAGGTYLTSVRVRKSHLQSGISMDQIIAHEAGKQTQLASLELSMDTAELVGTCEGNAPCAYGNTISWRTPATPNPMEYNPRIVFERLFGDSNSTDAKERLNRLRRKRSVLDSVGEEVAHMAATLQPSDKNKLTEYLEAVRDLERRIELAEEQSARELPRLDRPVGVPANFETHVNLMFDLQILAYRTDMTRIITFMFGRELTPRTYTEELGIPDPHHPITHHAGDQEKIAKVIQINIFHAKMFANYLRRLQATPDGDGNLLDHMVVLYGGGLSDGNLHLHNNLPTMLLSGNPKYIQGGRHVMYPKEKNTPLANLHMTLMDKFGVHVENFGDGNREINLLSV